MGQKLWYDKPRRQFYLLVNLEIEVVDPMPEHHQRIVGVDVGRRYLAVATDTQNRTKFFPSKVACAKADHYARLRKRLQQKGTRSATRRLVALAGRERRLKQDRNHVISRRIVDTYPHGFIGLEELTHIRERTNGRRKQGKGPHRSNAEPAGMLRSGPSPSCTVTWPTRHSSPAV